MGMRTVEQLVAAPQRVVEDRQLVARMAAGDQQALTDLYARYAGPLFNYLRLLSGDASVAEELLQDTLLAAWRGAARYAGNASVHAWLLGIARRRAHDVMRRRVGQGDAAWAAEAARAVEPDPEQLALAQVELDALAAAIRRLAPIHHEVLVLAFQHELSYRELSAVLDIPLGTVKSRLNHAKRALAAQLLAKDKTA
jgi:RNA polymerase sigma-70 factor (ECF subfamily)